MSLPSQIIAEVQNGLGIMGCRASATNTIGITYVNSTAATITPATETYLVGNFQMVIPDGGNVWIQTVVPAQQQAAVLLQAIRAALVNTGFTAGS